MSELEHSAASSSELPRFEREGLPPTYRMRADAHYVDQLDAHQNVPVIRLIPTRQIEAGELTPSDGAPAFARSVAQHGILQPLLVRRNGPRFQLIAGRKRLGAALMAGLTEVPCIVHDVDAAGAASLGDADNLRATEEPAAAPADAAALRDVLDMLHYDVADMAPLIDLLRRTDALQHRTFADVLFVQAWRAAWLASATGMAAAPYRPRPGATIGSMIDRVRTGLDREARVSRLRIEYAVSADAAAVVFDEQLETVITGLVFLTMSWQQRSDSPRVEVRADVVADGAIKLQIIQRAAAAPSDAARLFRSGDAGAAADPRLTAAVMAVRAFAANYGTAVDVLPIGRAGSVIQILIGSAALN